MSVAAAQAAAFYEEVARNRIVWAIRDAGGYPAPQGTNEKRAMPFWSAQSRAEKIIANVSAYRGFQAEALTWEDFKQRWLPGLTEDGLLVGVNWSGQTAKGYDIEPADLLRNVETMMTILRERDGHRYT